MPSFKDTTHIESMGV